MKRTNKRRRVKQQPSDEALRALMQERIQNLSDCTDHQVAWLRSLHWALGAFLTMRRTPTH